MIQNLNQVAFQKFGIILPERRKNEFSPDNGVKLSLNPDQKEIPVYRTVKGIQLILTSGKSVLSTSEDGVNFLHFYFDKPVCIKSNTYFFLTPFMGDAAVAFFADTVPETVSARPNSSFRMDRQVCVEGIYTFFYQEREAGFIFSGEKHPMPELTYVDQGELHSVADGQDILLKQGDIALWGPNQWHMHYADPGVAPRYVTITFDLEGVDITPLLNRKFPAPQKAVSLIQQMLREQERMDAYAADMMLSQLTALLVTLLRYSDAPDNKLRASNSIHSENEIIRRAQQYISANIRERLSVPILAQRVDISPSYLTALFHKHLQISPGEYIRRIKLQESKQMIREDNMNFTEIATTLGYSSVHHFSRQFKENCGITPTEYAKSVR